MHPAGFFLAYQQLHPEKMIEDCGSSLGNQSTAHIDGLRLMAPIDGLDR